MCCNGGRIIVLLVIILSSFVLNFFYPRFAVVQWYFLLANIIAFLFLLIDKIKIKKIPIRNLYYFSLIGGALGGLLGSIVFFQKDKGKKFIFIQILILLTWIMIILLVIMNFNFIHEFLNKAK